MKRALFVYAVFLVFALASCKKDTVLYGKEYNLSYNAWLNFKGASGNSYSYMVTFSSWTGYSSETIITVKKGEVVECSNVSKQYDSTGAIITSEWKETGSQLGTHQNKEMLRTLDDIYTEARNNWLVKRDNAEVFFETKNNGMISSCGYVPKGCADDCFMGITIKYIKEL